MGQNKNFSGRLMQLDMGVWLVMLAALVLSLVLLAFKSSGEHNCAPMTLSVDGQPESGIAVRSTNKLLIFSLKAAGKEKVTWSFDDGSAKVAGSSVPHRFLKEGVYKVVAKVNGGCRYEQLVSVRAPALFGGQSKPEIHILTDPVVIKAGSSARLFCVTNINARSYQWELMSSPDSAKYGSVVTFFFPEARDYRIKLTLDGDRKKTLIKTVRAIAEQQQPATPFDVVSPGGLPPINAGGSGGGAGVNIENPFREGSDPEHKEKDGPDEKKEQPAPEAKKKVDAATLQGLLEEVIAGNKEVSDLYPYLDYGESTKVQEAGKPALLNIGPFCREMMRRPNAKIKSVELSRDPKNTLMIIKVEVEESKRRRGFLGGIFGGND